MKKLFELNLDFNLWYKNLLTGEKIDRHNTEWELYKSGLIVLFISLPIMFITLSLCSIPFFFSCIVNYFYYIVAKPYYNKIEEKKRIELELTIEKDKEIYLQQWIDKYEEHVKSNPNILKLSTCKRTKYGQAQAPEDFNFIPSGCCELLGRFLYDFNLRRYDLIVTTNQNNEITCSYERRRSMFDLYKLCLTYFPDLKFIDFLKSLVDIIENKYLRYSFCSDVRKYVFYPYQISSHFNEFRKLEFHGEYKSNVEKDKYYELTFNDLLKYIKKCKQENVPNV
jgi:hypothetical protein